MARLLSTKRFKHLWAVFKRSKNMGFTLTELLVSIIIGSLLTVMLLSLVVELTKTNQEDAARSQVQQDMQAAMDYVVQDLREAVFVYNGQCLAGSPPGCSGVVNHIPPSMNQPGRTPVLAFWRTEPLPQRIRELCDAEAATLGAVNASGQPTNRLDIAGVPCIAGTTYSLVVYAIDTTNGNNLWRGNARLIRYKLSQFSDNPTDETSQNQGYVNPLSSQNFTFQQWPFDNSGSSPVNRQITVGSGNAYRPGVPTNAPSTLVDFVDARGAVDANGAPVTPDCSEFGDDAASQASALSPQGTGVPRGFYACVRNGGIGTSNREGENQDVLLTLVGNVTGQGGFSSTYDNKNRLSPLQTRVLVRGAVKKQA